MISGNIQSEPMNFIVAMDNNGGIGIEKNNSLPWHIPEDLKNFRKITNKSIVIMGSKTYESIPDKFRPLKNRFNIVITRNNSLLNNKQNDLTYKSGYIYTTYENVYYHICEMRKEIIEYKSAPIYIIGGEQIYRLFLNDLLHANSDNELENRNNNALRIYITFIERNYKCDVLFPMIPSQFHMTTYSERMYSEKENVHFRYLEYEYKNNNIGNNEESMYLDIAKDILENGKYRYDRTRVNTYSLFGKQMRFNISESIPILTTKKVAFKTCVYELLWMLRGCTDNKWLKDRKVRIWNGNSTREYLDSIGLNHLEEDDCGKCYGFQWRHFGGEYKTCKDDYTGVGYDQIADILNLLRNNPYSRRIILQAWNPSDLNKTCLPPCHMSIQFYVEDMIDENGNKYRGLSGHMYQRSADWFLGEPFNILSYTVLIYLLAEICGMKPNELIISTGDSHIYSNHKEQMLLQIKRMPLARPKLWINPNVCVKKLDELDINDFDLIGYLSHPTITGKMAV